MRGHPDPRLALPAEGEDLPEPPHFLLVDLDTEPPLSGAGRDVRLGEGDAGNRNALGLVSAPGCHQGREDEKDRLRVER